MSEIGPTTQNIGAGKKIELGLNRKVAQKLKSY